MNVAIRTVWNTSTTAREKDAWTRKPSPPSDRDAPRTETAATPKKAPDASPISAGRASQDLAIPSSPAGARADDIAITPARLTRMPTVAAVEMVSPKNTSANTAAWTVSVFE